MTPEVSVVIISFNTRDLLRECLTDLYRELEGIPNEVFVVDNVSRDASAEMVEREFPQVRLIRSPVNLGFGAANNRAFALATGRYVVLLNSDAFLQPGSLRLSIRHMDAEPRVGWGGSRLIGRDGSWQASARMFPSPLNDLLRISGLAAKFPASRFFGREDHTWEDQSRPIDADWVPGAFGIIRGEALRKIGYFDENFFLYYEEVDLCRRLKKAGYLVRYFPDVVVIHLGGESSKTIKSLRMSRSGAQLELWRMRSGFLYYRKHHGAVAWIAKQIESGWHLARSVKNRFSPHPEGKEKASESGIVISLLDQAWRETSGGKVSPARPW
ncbi:MAG TPA: glycosyltransferase family 2 protein [Bryobacteraceae bacterium]|nr:glycosyltransferase family 2 protein [Bryobacteraceae bacterium]